MRQLHRALLVAAFAASVSCPAKPADRIAGDWQGWLKVMDDSLTVVFHISRTDDGGLSATMDSPDQGAAGIEVAGVTLRGDSVMLEVAAAAGRYRGRLARGGTIEGKWSQAGQEFELVLSRTEAAASPRRPQEPEPPLPYEQEEVQFDNTEAMVTLAGTLTLPEGDGPFPALVLVSGSGAQDRNSQVFGHKPFLVLADHLTRSGLAVLRFDDRGVGQSGGDPADATTDDFASDAQAALDYLRARPEVDRARVGVVGHSEGALVAALLASRGSDAGLIVMLAGTGVPGEQVLYRQAELLNRAAGESEELIAAERRLQEAVFAAVRSSAPTESLGPRVERAIRATLAGLDSAARARIEQELDDEAIARQAAAVTSPWFRHFLAWDPAPTIRKVKVPVLALTGSKDLQAAPGQNLPAIEAALAAGGNPDHTVKELPGLNHLLQTAATGSVSEYAQIEETMAPLALETISGWILERFRE